MSLGPVENHSNAELQMWIRACGGGLSALAMCYHLAGLDRFQTTPPSFPYDADDFGRCVALVEAAPSVRERIPELACLSLRWQAIAENWQDLESAFKSLPAEQFTRLLRETMSATVDPSGPISQSPERQEIALSVLRNAAPQHEGDESLHATVYELSLAHGTHLANEVVRLLVESNVESFSVYLSEPNHVAAVAQKAPAGGGSPFTLLMSPEDFYCGPLQIHVHVKADDPAFLALI